MALGRRAKRCQLLKETGEMSNTTEALADKLGIKPQTIRARLCRTGSYFGEKPRTLPNGWLWCEDGAFERIAFGKDKDAKGFA
jgi:hypothetical protein